MPTNLRNRLTTAALLVLTALCVSGFCAAAYNLTLRLLP